MKEKKLINYNDKEKQVGWPNFSEVFMVSSLTGDGMEGVMVRSEKYVTASHRHTIKLISNILVFRNFYFDTARTRNGNTVTTNALINHRKLWSFKLYALG